LFPDCLNPDSSFSTLGRSLILFLASSLSLKSGPFATTTFTLFDKSVPAMAPSQLEQEDHARDAAFKDALHGKSTKAQGGFAAMRGKDAAAQKAAVDEYFKHWDNKEAETETDETRAVSMLLSLLIEIAMLTLGAQQARRAEYATLTKQYALAT
jgi:hypothetical protein